MRFEGEADSSAQSDDGACRSLLEEAQQGWTYAGPEAVQMQDINTTRRARPAIEIVPAVRNFEKARRLLQDIVSDDRLFDRVLDHLYKDLILETHREHAQAFIRRLTLVQKAWEESASRRLYKNPFFGTAERAERLAECLEKYPERARLVRKLIFGEGSSADVKDWKSPSTVPRIVNASQKLEIIGFDGLVGVDSEAFKDALVTAPCLEEIRSCGAPHLHFRRVRPDQTRPCPPLKDNPLRQT